MNLIKRLTKGRELINITKTTKNYKQWNLPHYVWEDFEHFQSLWGPRTGIHTIHFGDNESTIDLLFGDGFEEREAKVQPIFFTAAVGNRENKTGPFFTGVGLANRAEIPLISVADPSLDEDPTLNLAWYVGAHGSNFRNNLNLVLTFICQQLGREPLFVGGSGGGFASLISAEMYPHTSNALVWNPQTDIFDYVKEPVQSFLRSRFGMGNASLARDDWKSFCRVRTDKEGETQISGPELVSKTRRLVYLQNSKDWHKTAHLTPLWETLSEESIVNGKNFYDKNHLFYINDFSKGHTAPPEQLIRTILIGLMKETTNIEELFGQIDP